MQVNWTPATALPAPPRSRDTASTAARPGRGRRDQVRRDAHRRDRDPGHDHRAPGYRDRPTPSRCASLAGAKLSDPFPAQSAGAPGQASRRRRGHHRPDRDGAPPGGATAAPRCDPSVALHAGDRPRSSSPPTAARPSPRSGRGHGPAVRHADPDHRGDRAALGGDRRRREPGHRSGLLRTASGRRSHRPGAPPAAAGLGRSWRWATTDTTITGYDVQLYSGDGTASIPSGAVRTTTDKTLTVTGLGAGTYNFTVLAKRGATPGRALAEVHGLHRGTGG